MKYIIFLTHIPWLEAIQCALDAWQTFSLISSFILQVHFLENGVKQLSDQFKSFHLSTLASSVFSEFEIYVAITDARRLWWKWPWEYQWLWHINAVIIAHARPCTIKKNTKYLFTYVFIWLTAANIIAGGNRAMPKGNLRPCARCWKSFSGWLAQFFGLMSDWFHRRWTSCQSLLDDHPRPLNATNSLSTMETGEIWKLPDWE